MDGVLFCHDVDYFGGPVSIQHVFGRPLVTSDAGPIAWISRICIWDFNFGRRADVCGDNDVDCANRQTIVYDPCAQSTAKIGQTDSL